MPGQDELSLFVERLEAAGAPYMLTPWLERQGFASLWEKIRTR